MHRAKDQRGDDQRDSRIPAIVNHAEEHAPEDNFLENGNQEEEQEGSQLREPVELRPSNGITVLQGHHADNNAKITDSHQKALQQVFAHTVQGEFRDGPAFRQIRPNRIKEQAQQTGYECCRQLHPCNGYGVHANRSKRIQNQKDNHSAQQAKEPFPKRHSSGRSIFSHFLMSCLTHKFNKQKPKSQ